MYFDKSHLPKEIQEKQKIKGTFDSPCQSVCNYLGEGMVCQTCKMSKFEKKSWKIADLNQKKILLNSILERRKE